jgi:hypothetical protein
MARAIRNLEIHAAHACNLTCESCSHYSNQGHKGMLALADAESWMAPWAARLDPLVFSILGGEPTINPDLAGIVRAARRHWPRAMIRIVTNGFFLRRHPDLPHLLRDDGNALLYVSIHHNSSAYQEKLAPIVDLLHEWITRHGVRVIVYRSYVYWTQRYLGFGAAMEPFADGDPRASWEICTAKYCTQLFEGKLWKCAPLAYLGLQAQKYDLSSRWAPYLGYTPLAPECSDAELDGFFAREEEPVCGMCPARERPMKLPLPLPGSAAQRAGDPLETEAEDSPLRQLEALGSQDPIQGLLSRIDSPLFSPDRRS